MPTTPSQTCRSFLLFVSLFVLLWLPVGMAQASVGKVMFVAGDVRVERPGVPAEGLPLAQGDALASGDTVVTATASRAQLLMADGARIALRAGRRYRIDELSLPETVSAPGQARAVDADGRSVATLLRGGFRTQTGSIGKQDAEAYEVRTPVGVLGIRGTEYVVVLCQGGDCSESPGVRPGELIRDGLYLGVFRNRIVFTAPGQPPRDLGAGDFVFIPLVDPAIEVLPSPPPFMLEDDHGPLELPGAPPEPTPPSELQDFTERRVPPDEVSGAGPDRDERAPSLPIGGTGRDGEPVDLTPGDLPPQAGLLNDAAFALGQFGDLGILVNSSAGTENSIVLEGGGLLSFPVLLQLDSGAAAATVALGSSSNTDLGGAAGLSWGRWSGGALAVSGDGVGPFNQSLATQSLHWIAHEPVETTPVLPISGSVPFQLIGGTTPTNTAGATGVLGGASLAADFTAGSVSATLAVQIDGLGWFAAGTAAFADGNRFAGVFQQGNLGGTLPIAGAFAGFLSEPAGSTGALSAGLAWTLEDILGDRPVVTGVLAFGPGSGQPLAPLQLRRDIAIAIGQFGQFPLLAGVLDNAADDYAIDANLDIVRLEAARAVDGASQSASYALGTAQVTEAGVDPATLLRWGRWSGGIAEVTDDAGNTSPLDLQQGSLHWVTSPNASSPPVLPQAGVASYSLVGATTPTSNTGQSGVLGGATFVADFTNQQVESTINLQMGDNTWQAVGGGSIGAQADLPAHQFRGFYDSVQITGPNTDTGFGEFSGFFSGPGASPQLPNLPGGAGLSYSLSDSDFVETIQGVLIFQSLAD